MPDVLDLLPRAACGVLCRDLLVAAAGGAQLALAGLDGFFARAFTPARCRGASPRRTCYSMLAASMGVRPDACLVIEDSRPGLLAARAAGMEAVFLAAGSHLRGTDGWPDLAPAHRRFESWKELGLAFPDLFQPALAEALPDRSAHPSAADSAR
jgi:beta-phosphoglucomutase-like phosphatase (HAD superfamily)